MNFNFSGNAEYALNASLIEETINLYGVLTKFLITEKINKDDIVFGDYTHMKSDNAKIYDVYMLPEVSEDWESTDYAFNQFGMTNTENINLFVARSNVDLMNLTAEHVTGNLVILPNNKIMEVTSAMWEVPGVNNLFTFSDARSVLRLTCKPYDNKLISELAPADISVDPGTPYATLDNYFQELITQAAAQDTEAEVTAQVPAVTGNVAGVDTITNEPIVDKSEDDIWGHF